MDAPAPITLYESLPATTNRKLERCAVAINKATAKGIELIFEIGQQLRIAHDELANHGDGTFGKWCVERCGMTYRCARQYLDVVEVFGERKQLVCEPGSQSFDAKALYYLSREVTPEDAIEDAIKAAKKGERITLAKAKEFVAEYTVEQSEQDEEEDQDEEADDAEETEWDWGRCQVAIERTAQECWQACPPAERESIPRTLRFIADKLEKRLNGHST